MKTISKIGILLALTGSLLTACVTGEYYVTTRPVEPYYVRPASPYANAVWIDGEWIWTNGRYSYVGGHWDRGRGGRAWVRGSWYSGPRGYTWHRGHWR